ncbi:Sec63 Brl domain-containing protein [Polychytrium aggregatum]|uniref:Sec63 Brl domain-containing protein n=1 Tax=Polychytrium aggregatum TaxID=110093 RepID=UPI0022FDD9AD|nr:Sec63 Brl domain-containing protein [Polychytrium aggregatum]KAI9206036.1 Sec63 Brl domain-containing protein [Polychytrium aggregatum]
MSFSDGFDALLGQHLNRNRTSGQPDPAQRWTSLIDNLFDALEQRRAKGFSAEKKDHILPKTVDYKTPEYLRAIAAWPKSDEPVFADVASETHQLQPQQTLQVEEPQFNRDWLLRQCEHHLANFAEADTMDPQQLCIDIFNTLRSDQSDDEIQSSFCDLLGFSNFDFIGSLITQRTLIISNIVSEAQGRSQKDLFRDEQPEVKSDQAATPHRPAYGSQVTVMSQHEKVELKQQRKEQKKKMKMAAVEPKVADASSLLGFDGDYLRRAREEQLANAASAPLIESTNIPEQPKYPNIYSSGSGGSMLSTFGTRFSLPVGSVRNEYKEYEEIVIPAGRPSYVRSTEKAVPISSLDEYSQRAYKSYKSLNRVQSIVFPIAFHTNENMLVCAPTGAGKTDIAMLTVLRTLAQYRVDGRLQKNDFKIVYVAPLKALAAEVVRKFSGRIGGSEDEGGLGVAVRELTGDMQLTRAELASTQMIVTTPEKWDVVTRKGTGDTELAQKVRLLIIDEVHLLHEDRGAVIESIVARTQRQVETSQTMIRIVGLSATLPNYVDVAQFLGVNPYQGLFYFDSGFRPVPLKQNFIGVKGKAGGATSKQYMNQVCYEKVIELVRDGHQVMVFVHSRKDTVKTSMMLRDEALNNGEIGLFDASSDPQYAFAQKNVAKSKNKELKELFASGFGIHHAGMLRSDRGLVEQYFEKGYIKVLCCTATLAWGVNLPAYAVVIKGTQVYDSTKGGFVDLSILDVLQIFGRAGRPQYEDLGEAFIVTSQDKLNHYVSALTQQHPIESCFAQHLFDNLNAEVSLGTVTTVDEAIRWLSYTYLYVRMRKNPLQYGLDWNEVQEDPVLNRRRRDLITAAARTLSKAQMIYFDEATGYLTPKDLGRIASNFYIRHVSIEVFNEMMRPVMTEADVLSMISLSSEFDNIKVREEEGGEMKALEHQSVCVAKGGTENSHGKTNILLQSYISRIPIQDFALVSDSAYVAQNSARILRALFEIAQSRNWGPTCAVILSLCKSVDRRMWSFQHSLLQFDLPYEVASKLEAMEHPLTIEEMREMSANDLGQLVRHGKMGATIEKCVQQFPRLALDATIAPITRTVLQVSLKVTPDFVWNPRVHGGVEPFWIWVEDAEVAEILHSEYFLMTPKLASQPQTLNFTIPVPRSESTVDELPPQIFIRAVSDKWIGSETVVPISFKHLILPSHNRTPHTQLLDLQPLHISALNNPMLEDICRKRFEYFNPVQTQIFHTLYRTKHNVLIGAPTGSGKTVAAELAMWAAFRDKPNCKVVYIAPLKALVRERVADWRARLVEPMGRSVVELTGDVTPNIQTLMRGDIIITTPEKWDGISRSWQNRSYVQKVSLVIIDEIHLLGADRGPILEVIVSRMNYIANQTGAGIRIVGLSTALANAGDLGDWLGIKDVGLFNFEHSVRPVPLEIYIDGFPGKHYCPRMISMNKPTYSAIMTHSPTQPVIVFVSSRRQTRLTARDLIAFCALDENPRRFLKLAEEDLEGILSQVKDAALKLSLGFGIGLHHAGLIEGDRKIVEELFVNNKIQILIATSTLAWGVNYPAHLVVVKGTEYFDAKTHGYVDFPITDVLQMMGRAGRPQFDNHGVACVFVQDSKKNFYKKFLHEPFPVESSLHKCLHNHINAEVVGGTIRSKQDMVDYLTWTYFYRRLHMNPAYYGVEDVSPEGINIFLSRLVNRILEDLANARCIEFETPLEMVPTTFGRIASYYYLDYRTMDLLTRRLTDGYRFTGTDERDRPDGDFAALLQILCDVPEYEELPVRHKEDELNMSFQALLPIQLGSIKARGPFGGIPRVQGFDSPHFKSFLLLQAHLSRLSTMPCADYSTDQISVLDQAVRLMQAMVDVSAVEGFYSTSLGVMNTMQCIKQALWPLDSTLLQVPGMTAEAIAKLARRGIKDIETLARLPNDDIGQALRQSGLDTGMYQEAVRMVHNLPLLKITATVEGATQYESRWVLNRDEEYEIHIRFDRERPYKTNVWSGQQDYKISSPRFPKAQYEGWWVVLSESADESVEGRELLGMRRVAAPQSSDGRNRGSSQSQSMSTSLQFTSPTEPGDFEYRLDVVSDGYRGLDRSTVIKFTVAARLGE